MWIDDAEVADVFARFAGVRHTPEPAIEISGGSGVSLMLAIAHGATGPGTCRDRTACRAAIRWRGAGASSRSTCRRRSRAEAIRWNARFEEESGLVVESDGRARYTGVLRDRLAALSPTLAEGFSVRDIEAVHEAMNALRLRLESRSE